MLNTMILKIEGKWGEITSLKFWRDVKCLQVSFWAGNTIQRSHKKRQRRWGAGSGKRKAGETDALTIRATIFLEGIQGTKCAFTVRLWVWVCVWVSVCVKRCVCGWWWGWWWGEHKKHKNRRSQLSPHLAKFASRLITAKKRQQLCSFFSSPFSISFSFSLSLFSSFHIVVVLVA